MGALKGNVLRRSGMLWLLALLMLVGQPVAVEAQESERLVLAFYYAWFDMDTWRLPLPDRPLNPYISADVSVIARHVAEARQADIDALITAWYGPTVHNNQTEPNFWALMDQAQGTGLRVGASVDMGGPFLQSTESVVQALATLRDRHTQHPAYLRVGGRPVVFFWNQENFSVPTWEAIRMQVDPDHAMLWIAEGTRPHYLEAFDGLYLYSVAWSTTPASVLTRWGNEVRQWEAAHGQSRLWVATVMPGYDDMVLAAQRPDAFVRARSDGNYYRACWQGAIQSQADWVVITSFNEWIEGSHIEPSTTYGDVYIGLTAKLAAAYRSASFGEPTPTPIPLPTETPEPPPTATPEPILLTPTATFTPTATPTLTPTATITPTATPFRLSTPTPTPTFPPTAELPPAPSVEAYPGSLTTATPEFVLPLIPVEGGSGGQGRCAPLPVLLPLALVLLARPLNVALTKPAIRR